MLFQRNSDISQIRDFYISTGPGSRKQPIAYGPGSFINGSVMITLDKPISAYSIRVIFKCEETDQIKKESSIIFSVDTVIWGGGNTTTDIIDLKPQDLSSGSHMYLFAIKLPHVNYPPSMHDNAFDHRIHYSLQGVIDLVSVPQHYTTPTVSIVYLPLVTGNPNQISKITQVFQKEDKQIKVSAELIKPAYCPGDLCTIKLITDNNSDARLTNVQVAFNAISTTLAPNNTDYVHKQHTLLTETFFVSIPKYAKDHQDVFKLQLPSQLVPTFTNKLGKYIDISYEITITIPLSHNNGSLFSAQPMTNTMNLPVLITTVPPDYSIQIAIQDSSDLPTFIPNVESPLPSLPADRAYSVSPSGSLMIQDDMDIDDNFTLTETTQKDASGHLMVPENTHRKSEQISVP